LRPDSAYATETPPPVTKQQLKMTREQERWLANRQPLSPAQERWFMEVLSSPQEPNPCVRLYGAGPEGKKCKQCALLYRKCYSRCYLKCRMRPDTNGPGTDHKARWNACAKFKPIERKDTDVSRNHDAAKGCRAAAAHTTAGGQRV